MKKNKLEKDLVKITDGIKIRYIYSACIITSTPDVSILHDPWFTEGIYDGSWYQYPKIKKPLDRIRDVDYIYVSHIHPDHYDKNFIKSYFAKYGIKKVLIANHKTNHLAGKMRADGIEAKILNEPLTIGNTEIQIIPHITGSVSDIDSAIIIKYKSKNKLQCVVNVNDIIFDDKMINVVKQTAGDVDILLCGYTGAGPYPQTYFDLSDSNIFIEAENKKKLFFNRYKMLVNKINAKVNIPFAGKYLLGGKLANLNSARGVADPVEILNIDKKAIVLSDNGGEINAFNLKPTEIRLRKYDKKSIQKRIEEIKNKKMDYERLFNEKEVKQLPLKRILAQAVKRAVSKSECEEDYYFCITLPENQYAIVNSNKNANKHLDIIDLDLKLPEPRSEIIIDPRYLFGLLTNIYHWNNAEVGSQFMTRRIPNKLNKKAQAFLNYLSI